MSNYVPHLSKLFVLMQALAQSLRQHRRLPSSRHAVRTHAAFGAKAKTANQVYLCIDCGYIYDGRVPFSELGKDYRCPVCQAPKRRHVFSP